MNSKRYNKNVESQIFDQKYKVISDGTGEVVEVKTEEIIMKL